MDTLPTQVHDHETRLRYLEKAVWIYTGAAAVGGGVIGQIIRTVGVG